MGKVYDKKPALAIGILRPDEKNSRDEGDMADGEDGEERGLDSAPLKDEAAGKLGDLLGIPKEKHKELSQALADYVDAHNADAHGEEDEEPGHDEEE